MCAAILQLAEGGTMTQMQDLEFVTWPIEVVGCHAEGEVGDVIVSGIATPPGSSVFEQSRWIAEDGRLRRLVGNEPRGGMFKHINLLVPPIDRRADLGFIIMEPDDTPLMSGSNSMCVATVALETGIVTMTEPTTTVVLEAPAGLVEVEANCADGKVVDLTIRNVPAFVAERDVTLEVPGIGRLRVDTAWGGDSFVMVDAGDLDVEITPENGADLARLGSLVTRAANEQLHFEHPTIEWAHFSFCQIAGRIERISDDGIEMSNTVVVEPGKLDRSPTGTGVSARMALLRAQGHMGPGDRLHMRSVIGSRFTGQIETDIRVGNRAAIVPLVTGRAWRYGRFTYETDPTDPWPLGYRVSDTWPN